MTFGGHFPLISAIVQVSTMSALAIGELERITVEECEAIRRAYYLEGKSKRQIAREQGHSRKTVDKAVLNRPAQPYRLTKPKPAPVFGAYRGRADELLAENAHLPTPGSSTLGTRSMNACERKATRAQRHGFACM